MQTILVVEDELAYLKLLREQLIKKAYKVITANDAIEGLHLATQYKPDLILLDIRMPGMNGLEMLESLRKDTYGKSARVIVLTNLEPDDAILQKVIANHPSFYLIKSDIRFTDLLTKIKDVFSNPFSSNA